MTMLFFAKVVLGWNLLVAVVYAYDKFLAWCLGGSGHDNKQHLRRRRNRWFLRVSEDFLLLLLFLGGCLGAWLAMEGLRHKTRKWSFRRRAMLLTIVNPLWVLLYYGATKK